MKKNSLGFKTLLFILTIMISTCGIVYAQPPPPPIPSDYSGYVTVNGEPAPDGALVYAKIEGYTSNSVAVSDGGRYRYLLVAPPDSTYKEKTIEFYIDPDADGPMPAAMAEETSTFELGTSHETFDLTVVIVDSTPPVISGISSSDVTTSGTKITWITDEPSTSQVDYGKTTAYGSSTTLDTNLVTSHSVTLTGLEAGTTYHFRVVSIDGTENMARSGDNTFTTATASTPPAPGPSPGPAPGPAPANKPPVADAGSNQMFYVNIIIHFSGSGSSDPDGTIVSYEWDFGDGGYASGVEAAHVYVEAGIYSATLTVTDDDGASDPDSCTVTILSMPTSLVAGAVEAVPANQIGYVVDASVEADTTVTLNTTAPVTVAVLRYEGNPHPEDPLPEGFVPKFVDISVSDPDAVVWPIYVEMTYTDEEVEGLDESSLGIYYWKDGAWHRCSDTGVDTERNVIWAYMTAEETSGSPILIGSSPPLIIPSLPPILSNLTITPEEIELGEEVTISVLVENIDSQSITYIVTMQIEGRRGDLPVVVYVELEAYESTLVSQTITPVTVGDHDVTVDGLTGSFTVNPIPLKPAEFVLSNFSYTSELQVGEPLRIYVDIANVGEQPGEATIIIKIDGTVEESQQSLFQLGPGDTIRQVWTSLPWGFIPGGYEVGTHTIQLDGFDGTFNVMAEAVPFWMNPYYIGGILILIAAGASVYMRYRGGRLSLTKSTPGSENLGD